MPKGKNEAAPNGVGPSPNGPLAGRANSRLRALFPGPLSTRGVPIQPTQIRPIGAEALSVEALSVEAPSAEALSVEAPSVEALSVEAPSVEALSVEAPSVEALSVETVTVVKGPRPPLPGGEASEQSLEEWIDETLGELPGQLLRRARGRATHDVSLTEPYLLGEPARDLLDHPRLVKRVQCGPGARVLRAPAELLSVFGTLFSTARGFVRPTSARRRPGAAHSAVLFLTLGASVACRSGDVNEPAPAAVPAVVAAAGATAAGPRGVKASERERPKASAPWRIPVGPNLVIAPGKGLGPIRFGARVDTIERLIGEPCEEKREEAGRVVCRYSAQAVDFVLQDGVVTEMRAHRLGRPFKPEPKLDYGIFNGRFAEGVSFGMLPAAARELLGAPKATRTVTEANPNNTVEVYDYDGFSLEFDRTTPQTVVLGGVVLKAPKS